MSFIIDDKTEVEELFDAMASSYDKLYAGIEEVQAEDALVLGWLNEVLSDTSAVLDVGCGTGWFPDNYPIDQRRYFGFDISKNMLHQAERKHREKFFLHGDMRESWPIYPTAMRSSKVQNTALCLWSAANYMSPADFLSMFVKSLGERLIVLARTSFYSVSRPVVELYTQPWDEQEVMLRVSELPLNVLDVRHFAAGGEVCAPDESDYIWLVMDKVGTA